MPVTRFEILSRGPYEDDRTFGDGGPYERIEAIAHYAVDPTNQANQGIVDLHLAERGDDGLVHFSGDVTMLRPLSGGSRALLMQVPNRGKRNITRFNMTVMGAKDTVDIDPGDGFLFNNGLTVAWAGWQWDVPRTTEHLRIGLSPPQVPLPARAPHSQMQLRLQINSAARRVSLTDHHVGDLGMHEPVPPADIADPGAKLLVRDSAYAAPLEIARAQWHFDGDSHIHLRGGFEAGRIYDLLYTPRDCPVVGAGLLATRELASYLRFDSNAPTAGTIDHVLCEGQSQCGRFLRTYLHLGLNLDEDGRQVMDGILAHIAGGRRGEFNHRYAQPSVQPTPSFGHLFPFADLPQTDLASAQTAGLLDRQTEIGGVPKIFYTDTSSEYWRGDAALSHSDLATGSDAVLPDGVRRYLFAGTQHGIGVAKWLDRTLFGSRGQNHLNVVDYRPLYRGALINLLAWVRGDNPPPVSAYPMAAERVRRLEAMAKLSAIPGLSLPDSAALTFVYPMDLGPDASTGIGRMPPVLADQPYPDWVSAVDDDGNEVGGVAMPDIAVPVATHSGFNPRHEDTGGAGQLLEYIGSTVPFAKDRTARQSASDPRLSIAERYQNRDQYLLKVRDAAQALANRRYILTDDINLCIDIAAARYDACVAQP
jgi:hypothetical protein